MADERELHQPVAGLRLSPFAISDRKQSPMIDTLNDAVTGWLSSARLGKSRSRSSYVSGALCIWHLCVHCSRSHSATRRYAAPRPTLELLTLSVHKARLMKPAHHSECQGESCHRQVTRPIHVPAPPPPGVHQSPSAIAPRSTVCRRHFHSP